MTLLEELCRKGNLEDAFRHIASNGGGPGIDGVRIDEFAAELPSRLDEIAAQIRRGTYRFEPALAVDIEDKRTIAILTVRDRAVSQALAQVLREPLEKCLHPACYAYRTGRSAVQATIDLHRELCSRPDPHVLRCDVHHFFDEIDWQILRDFLRWSLESDASLLPILALAAEQPMLLRGQVRRRERGVCQGAPLSPLLSNLYLSPLDRYLEKLGFAHWRYSDDIAVLLESADSWQGALSEIESFLDRYLRLRLNPEKSRLARFRDGFDFLGFSLSPEGRFPGKEAQERLRQRLENTSGETERAEAVQRWEAYYGSGSADSLPQDGADSPPQEAAPPIVSSLLELFRGNPDCFARAYRSPQRYGYVPVQRPLAAQDIVDHLLGRQTLGVYLLGEGKVSFACLDLDLDRSVMDTCYHNDSAAFAASKHRLLQHARRIQGILRSAGIEPLFEDSGCKGYHLWIFFSEPAEPATAIALWRKILAAAGPAPKQCQREIFPRESSATGLGSLIKLPLAIHPGSGLRSMFLDDAGEPIPNPQALLSGVVRIDPQIRDIPCEPAETASPADRLLSGCGVVRFLCDKARTEGHIGHFERIILLYTLGQLGQEGIDLLHRVIGQCRNYDRAYTQRHIDKKHPAPMGCRKIQEMMGDHLERIECRCTFERIPQGGYASPILHVYPDATRGLAKKIPKA